jgi:hypothetical protein
MLSKIISAWEVYMANSKHQIVGCAIVYTIAYVMIGRR